MKASVKREARRPGLGNTGSAKGAGYESRCQARSASPWFQAILVAPKARNMKAGVKREARRPGLGW
jgi:hypothetical protein